MHILIADDHDLFRDGIRLLLQQSQKNQISEARNREEINACIHNQVPDILLLDLDMPGVNGVTAITEICELMPKTAVIVVSGNDSSEVINACFRAGALGFIPKSSSTNTMLNAIQSVYAGNIYKPSQINATEQLHIALSSRQKEIYTHIIDGQSNKQIAYTLNISESTVKQHITELFRKLGVISRTQAIQKAKDIHFNLL